MTRLILFFCVCMMAGAQATWAQAPAERNTPPPAIEKGTGRISGTVVDSTSRQPVPFATVALINPANRKPLDGVVCDDKGQFALTKVPAGEYELAISFIGYQTLTVPLPAVVEKGTDINLGNISLAAEVQRLKEVTVVGRANLIEEKVDRTVYNAELDATSKGGDATDVLRRVPMLSVDLDGNVSLRGNRNITVLINGKPSTIMAGGVADALRQIPSDMIKSVEVITSPSARYDAEGSGGIINIITKKNTLQGLSLNIDGGVGVRGSNLGVNGGYRKGKMGFSLGGFGRGNYNVRGEFENDQMTTAVIGNNATQVRNTQKADTRNNGLSGRYTLGWDYDINKFNSLAASVQFGVRNNNTYQDRLFTQTFQNDALSGSGYRDVKITDLSNNVDVNLTYTRLFEKPQKEFSVLALYSRNNRTNNFLNSILNSNDFSVNNRIKNENDSYNQEITIQLDYQTPLGKNQMLELGGKNIMRAVVSDFQSFTAVGADGPFLLENNASLSNGLNYSQNITAGYFSYTLSTQKNYSLKIGSRYEYTTINARLTNDQGIDIPSYGVLVPSLNLSKKLKKGNTVKFSYNRRIQRPSLQFLNPNLQRPNPLNVTVGNPSLDPEYTNNFEVSYNTLIKATSLNFSTFVRNTSNAIQSLRDTVGGAGVIRTTYDNIGSENAYGFSVFANVNISNKFSLNGGTDVYYAVLNNNVPDPLYRASNEGWVANYRLFGNYTIKNGWGLQLFSFYRARQVQLQGFQGGFGIYSLSVRKEFKNKRGSIGFGAENFFTPTFRIRNELNSPVINQRNVNTQYYTNFKITFSYRIGKLSFDSTPRRRKSINNDDLKEGGSDIQGGGDGQPQGRPQGQGGRPAQTPPAKPEAPKQEVPK